MTIRAVEQTPRATYWRLRDGTYYATPPEASTPPITGGGYRDLETTKRINGDPT